MLRLFREIFLLSSLILLNIGNNWKKEAESQQNKIALYSPKYVDLSSLSLEEMILFLKNQILESGPPKLVAYALWKP